MKLLTTYMDSFLNSEIVEKLKIRKEEVFEKLTQADMNGWLEPDISFLPELFKVRDDVLSHSQCLVVIGIGGSYLGSQAFYSIFTPYFTASKFPIIYAGTTLSSNYMSELLEYLKDVDFSICYMSPMLRTVETAFILVGDRVETVPDTRLLERDMGELSGQSREKYDAVTYWDYDLNCSSLGVEPVQDVFKRCQEFLDYVIKKHSGEHILIVSHGAVIRACHHLLHHHNLHKNLLNVNISNLYCETIEILDKKK